MICVFEFVACVGCGSPSAERVDLAGRVTYAGRPVPTGRIDFIPALGESAGGPGGYAMITDGEFSTKVVGRGPPPGNYLAQINGFEKQTLTTAEVSHGERLFETYEVAITIGPGQKDVQFDVPTKSNR